MQKIADFLGIKISDLQMAYGLADEIDAAFYRDCKKLNSRDKETAAWFVLCGSGRSKMNNG